MNVTSQKYDLQNQKITVHIPRKLLREAQSVSNSNITETVSNGLQLIIATKAAENLRSMRGKVKFSIDVGELRKDR